MITLSTTSGLRIAFDPDDLADSWEIFDQESGLCIGRLAVDEDDMFVEADINPTYQRQGVGTAVVRYLVETTGRSFSFWKPDGLKYDDARHLSSEGAAWASSLIKKNLARWIENSHDMPDDEW